MDGGMDGTQTQVLVLLVLSPFRPNRASPDSHQQMGPVVPSGDAVGSLGPLGVKGYRVFMSSVR